jgi:hypothetical protein
LVKAGVGYVDRVMATHERSDRVKTNKWSRTRGEVAEVELVRADAARFKIHGRTLDACDIRLSL